MRPAEAVSSQAELVAPADGGAGFVSGTSNSPERRRWCAGVNYSRSRDRSQAPGSHPKSGAAFVTDGSDMALSPRTPRLPLRGHPDGSSEFIPPPNPESHWLTVTGLSLDHCHGTVTSGADGAKGVFACGHVEVAKNGVELPEIDGENVGSGNYRMPPELGCHQGIPPACMDSFGGGTVGRRST